MSYRTAELAFAVFLISVAALALISAQEFPADARMFPGILLIFLLVLTFVMVFRSFRGASQRAVGEEIAKWQFTENTRRLFAACAIFSIYLFLVEPLGFFTASVLLIFALPTVANFRNRIVILLTTAAFCLFVYTVFVLVFERPLPKEFFQQQASLSDLTGGFDRV